MKTLILILIILSFIQTTILSLNLVLIILIARSLIRPERNNLTAVFCFGLLISHLTLQPLGYLSLIYLILVQATLVLSKSRLSANPFLIIPLTGVLSTLNLTAVALLAHQSTVLMPQIFIESFLALPIFYSLRLWEERFIVRKEIKLRV
ncbi:MAG: Uncharacterized protein G01um10147_161 [Microgenomates group bacterium Gr01-1014_7]|nr:MAG: Uncharacterized protein G01um10147_161 [Microgenomates group bacterium Gr01-1014_7]